MPLNWKLYRLLCICQLILASYFLFTSLINFFGSSSFSSASRILSFLLINAISIMAINLLNNNYPDSPVTGSQKNAFNWLFLLNFLFLAFLFGFVMAEYRTLKKIAVLLDSNIMSLPFQLLMNLLAHVLVLSFQLVILYGLYTLRRSLYENFIKQEFEFEKRYP